MPLTSMSRNLGVLSAAASELDTVIASHGGDVDRIFGTAGIDPEQLQHPTLSLGLGNYCRVLEEAAAQSGCDNFGLHYGGQFKPQRLGLLGYVGLCSPTAEAALQNFAAAFPFHQPAATPPARPGRELLGAGRGRSPRAGAALPAAAAAGHRPGAAAGLFGNERLFAGVSAVVSGKSAAVAAAFIKMGGATCPECRLT